MKHVSWLLNLKTSTLKYLADSFDWSSRLFFLTLWLPAFAIAFHLELDWGLPAKNTVRTFGCCLVSHNHGALIVSAGLLQAFLLVLAAVPSACPVTGFDAQQLVDRPYCDLSYSAAQGCKECMWSDWTQFVAPQRSGNGLQARFTANGTATLCRFGWSILGVVAIVGKEYAVQAGRRCHAIISVRDRKVF